MHRQTPHGQTDRQTPSTQTHTHTHRKIDKQTETYANTNSNGCSIMKKKLDKNF